MTIAEIKTGFVNKAGAISKSAVANVQSTVKGAIESGKGTFNKYFRPTDSAVAGPVSNSTDIFNNNIPVTLPKELLDTANQPNYKIHIISQVTDVDGKPIRLSAYLPETINVDYHSDFATPFAQNPLMDNLVGNILRARGNSAIVQNMTFKIWESTRGLSFSIPLIFVADDEFDGDQTNIRLQILRLMKLCAPSKVQGQTFLRPPGPSLKFAGGFTDSFVNEVNNSALFNRFKNMDMTDKAIEAVSMSIPIYGTIKQGQYAWEGLSSGWKALSDAATLVQENVTSVYIGNFMYLESVTFEGVSEVTDMILDENGKPIKSMVTIQFSTSMVPTIEDLYRIYMHTDKLTQGN